MTSLAGWAWEGELELDLKRGGETGGSSEGKVRKEYVK